MSAGDLGTLKWIVTGDDAPLDAILDRAEAKVRAWAERTSKITGGIGGPGSGPTSTFGGSPVSAPNQASSSGPPAGIMAQAAAAGMARFYHGGQAGGTGPRWFSPDVEYAKAYAAKSGGIVSYIDLPESHPLLSKAFDDTGTNMRAPYNSFEAPADVANRRRALYGAPVGAAKARGLHLEPFYYRRPDGGMGMHGDQGPGDPERHSAPIERGLSRVEAMRDARAYAEVEDIRRMGARGAFPPVMPGGAGGAGAGAAGRAGAARGGFLGPPSGIGLLMSFMFGGWEVAKANQAVQVGAINTSLAVGDVAKLQSELQTTQQAWSGVLSSSVGMALDLFDAGPVALQKQITSTMARRQAQDESTTAALHRSNVQAIAGFSPTGPGRFQRRAAGIRGGFAESQEAEQRTIAALAQELNAPATITETESGLGTFFSTGFMAWSQSRTKDRFSYEIRDAKTNQLKAARDRTESARIEMADALAQNAIEMKAFSEDFQAGVRGTYRAASLITATIGANPVQVALAQLANVQGGAPDAIAKVARETAGFNVTGFASQALNMQPRGLFGALSNPAAMAAAAQQQALIGAAEYEVVEANRSRELENFEFLSDRVTSRYTLAREHRDAALSEGYGKFHAAWGEAMAKGDTGRASNLYQARQLHEKIINQQYDDSEMLTALSQQTEEQQLQAALTGNFAGAEAIGISGGAIMRATQFAQAGNTSAAKKALDLGVMREDLLAKQFTNRFRSEQVSYLEFGAPNRAGLDDPLEVLKTIDQEIGKLNELGGKGGQQEDAPALLARIADGIAEMKTALENLASD